MKKEELVINWGFGLSLIYWGIAGFYFNYEEFSNSSVRFFITLLNISVGLLLLIRNPVLTVGSTYSTLISLPSFICGGLMFKLSKSLDLWEHYMELMFLTGGLITLTSFLFLGRNFSILPGLRQIVSNGPFRLIRHPAYFGEFLMVFACFLARENTWALIPLLIFIPGIMFRIKEEELLLSKSSTYQKYMERVKWRLLPFIW